MGGSGQANGVNKVLGAIATAVLINIAVQIGAMYKTWDVLEYRIGQLETQNAALAHKLDEAATLSLAFRVRVSLQEHEARSREERIKKLEQWRSTVEGAGYE